MLQIFKKTRKSNWILCSYLQFSVSMQPDGVNLWYFKLILFNLTELLVWNVSGVWHWVAKIKFENQSLDCANDSIPLIIHYFNFIFVYTVQFSKMLPSTDSFWFYYLYYFNVLYFIISTEVKTFVLKNLGIKYIQIYGLILLRYPVALSYPARPTSCYTSLGTQRCQGY